MKKMIPYSKPSIDETDVRAVSEVLRSQFLTQGPQVSEFERVLGRYLEVENVVVVANGTAALHLAYVALGTSGARVLTSPITFSSTANMALAAGADVGFVDVDPVTGLMSPEALERSLRMYASEERSKIVVPVSLNGQVPDLPAIRRLADTCGAVVLEDAAHSLGGEYRVDGRTCKSASCQHTDGAILSFHPLKSICCAEGGAVVMARKETEATVRLLRHHGLTRLPGTYYREQEALGWNYRLTDLQCALGISQLKRLPHFLDRRRALAKRYREALAHDPLNRFLSPIDEGFGHAHHLFVVHFGENKWRESAYTFLREKNIETMVHYPPVYRLRVYEKRLGAMRLPGAEAYYRGCLSLPLYVDMTEAEQDYVLEALTECVRRF
jgi:dTDP-4-amino-4,6-dideoxygalactose transaminase